MKTEAPSTETVSFRSLPLGGLFRYPGSKGVFVVLEKHGCGKIAVYGTTLDWVGQGVFSFADSEDECASGRVEVVTQPHEPRAKYDAYSKEPKQVLAVMALQSDRYSTDADFRDAVDAVLRECGIGNTPTKVEK